MKYRKKSGIERPDGLPRDSLGPWLTYGVGVDSAHGVRVPRCRVRRGDQSPSIVQHLRPGAAEGISWARAQDGRARSSYILATKSCHSRDRRRQRTFTRADPEANRPFAQTPGHRLRRPNRMPPLRSGYAHRRNDDDPDHVVRAGTARKISGFSE